MSLSPRNPSHESKDTISKSSSDSRIPTLLPSTLPKNKPKDPPIPSSDSADNSTTPNAQFASFFTLIEDIHTTHHHHPTVHYIFSDDSTDLITEAALRTLEPPPPPSSSSITPQHQDPNNNNSKEEATSISDNPTDPSALPLLPPPRPGITDRYILLDLALSPSGNTVLSAHAHSLTPDWQVLNVEVSHAPTWDANPDPQGRSGAERNKGLMLKIEGTEGVRDGLEPGVRGGNVEMGEGREGEEEVDMEGLVRVFEKRMGELRRLIDVEAEAGLGAGERNEGR